MQARNQDGGLLRPALAGQLGTWELFPGTHVLGIREIDRFMQTPTEKCPVIMRALSQMDGEHTLDQISASLRSAGWALDVNALYRKAAAAGLISGVPFAGDIDRWSLKLLQFKLGWLARTVPWISRCYPIFLCLPVLAIMGIMAGLLYSGTDGLPASLWLLRAKLWRPANVEQWFAMGAGILLSILFHEGAHAITALKHGLVPSRIRLIGYLGFIPYIMLSIPGLYTVPPANRLKIWIAGPVGSFTVAALSQSALVFLNPPGFSHRWLTTMVLVNLGVGVWNLCPLMPTDGYFVLCTLLRIHNLRLNAWRALGDMIRLRRMPRVALLVFGIASLSLIAVLWQRNVFRILHFFSYSIYGYILVAVSTALLIVRQVSLAAARRSAMRTTQGNKP